MLRRPFLARTSRLAASVGARTAYPPDTKYDSRLSSNQRSITTVSELRHVDIEAFRRDAFIPGLPRIIRSSHALPAKRWFAQNGESSASLSSETMKYGSAILPYEFFHRPHSAGSDPTSDFAEWLGSRDDNLARHLINITAQAAEAATKHQDVFRQFFAPLDLLSAAIQFNAGRQSADRVKRLYVAQSQLNELPEALLNDLPVPDFVRRAGKGDIYNSSIWMGLEPTYTPLHRDPNPNLFVQIWSGKTIRLLTPALGQQLYAQVQQQVGLRGNSRFRGPEMMQGPEREALYEAIWGSELSNDIHEAVLGPDDALFIPKGWWHSVRSRFDDGRLNASVNWWFR